MFLKIILTILLFPSLLVAAQATLIDRGGGLIYDDVLDITWLQDANLGGRMSWNNAVEWTDNLSYGGFDDWRLPSVDVNGDQGISGFFDGIVDCSTATEFDIVIADSVGDDRLRLPR